MECVQTLLSIRTSGQTSINCKPNNNKENQTVFIKNTFPSMKIYKEPYIVSSGPLIPENTKIEAHAAKKVYTEVSKIKKDESPSAPLDLSVHRSEVQEKVPAPYLHSFSDGKVTSVKITESVKQELNGIDLKSDAQFTKYFGDHQHVIPDETPHQPNKSRLKKVYATEREQEMREKNNIASRNSRLKRKRTYAENCLKAAFYTKENSLLFHENEWLLYELEKIEYLLLNNNGSDESLLKELRAQCMLST